MARLDELFIPPFNECLAVSCTGFSLSFGCLVDVADDFIPGCTARQSPTETIITVEIPTFR